MQVSIHAPAKGATALAAAVQHGQIVSIHAPAKGATFRGLPIPRPSMMFLSTRPRRARLSVAGLAPRLSSFYPRAREGRDGRVSAARTVFPRFYPRAREGRDLAGTKPELQDHRFLSTRPRRARRMALEDGTTIYLFLSTRPRRARLPGRGWRWRSSRFLSTRPRRARLTLNQIRACDPCVSIHAPAKGATC